MKVTIDPRYVEAKARSAIAAKRDDVPVFRSVRSSATGRPLSSKPELTIRSSCKQTQDARFSPDNFVFRSKPD